MKKINLAENMLRFGIKNLDQSSQFRLKRVMEQSEEEKIVTNFDRDYDYKAVGDVYFFKLKDTPVSSRAKNFKAQGKFEDWTEADGVGKEAIRTKVFGQQPAAATAKTGCVSGNCKNGKGKYVYDDGDIYEGEWKDGNKHGKGKYVYDDGTVYEGEFKDDKRHGQGKQKNSDGSTYEGERKDGKRHGKGKQKWPDGTVYEGEFKDGKFHGKGKRVYDDGEVYEGDWQDGDRHGQGKYVYSDGDIYEGEWKDGVRNGKGKYVWNDGTVYEGDWQDGDRHGQGKQKWPSGDYEFGKWENDTFILGRRRKDGKTETVGIWPFKPK